MGNVVPRAVPVLSQRGQRFAASACRRLPLMARGHPGCREPSAGAVEHRGSRNSWSRAWREVVMSRALWVAWVAAALVVGVGCERPSSQKAKSAFLVRPETIEFGPAALGRTKSFKLKIANGGRASYR